MPGVTDTTLIDRVIVAIDAVMFGDVADRAVRDRAEARHNFDKPPELFRHHFFS